MSIFTRLVDGAVGLIKAITGRQAKISEILTGIWQVIPEVITFWNEWRGSDAEARVREFWEEFDLRTGLEGLDIIRDLPPEVEERIFDGVKAAGLELSLYAIGYYSAGVRPDAQDLKLVSAQISRGLADHLSTQLKTKFRLEAVTGSNGGDPAPDPKPAADSRLADNVQMSKGPAR